MSQNLARTKGGPGSAAAGLTFHHAIEIPLAYHLGTMIWNVDPMLNREQITGVGPCGRRYRLPGLDENCIDATSAGPERWKAQSQMPPAQRNCLGCRRPPTAGKSRSTSGVGRSFCVDSIGMMPRRWSF